MVHLKKVNKTDLTKKEMEIEKAYPCDFCEVSYDSVRALKAHIDIVHANSRHHECDNCGKRFGTKGNLLAHMNTTHE